jgi:hypothetical protein
LATSRSLAGYGDARGDAGYSARQPTVSKFKTMLLMKTILSRTCSLGCILGFALGATIAAGATTPSSAEDPAAQALARKGSVPVAAVGRHVEPGTFRVQVSAKLGRPDTVLKDGTWLYHHRQVAASGAEGTLVVRFEGGRVSSLALVTPAVAAALNRDPLRPQGAEFAATK